MARNKKGNIFKKGVSMEIKTILLLNNKSKIMDKNAIKKFNKKKKVGRK